MKEYVVTPYSPNFHKNCILFPKLESTCFYCSQIYLCVGSLLASYKMVILKIKKWSLNVRFNESVCHGWIENVPRNVLNSEYTIPCATIDNMLRSSWTSKCLFRQFWECYIMNQVLHTAAKCEIKSNQECTTNTPLWLIYFFSPQKSMWNRSYLKKINSIHGTNFK